MSWQQRAALKNHDLYGYCLYTNANYLRQGHPYVRRIVWITYPAMFGSLLWAEVSPENGGLWLFSMLCFCLTIYLVGVLLFAVCSWMLPALFWAYQLNIKNIMALSEPQFQRMILACFRGAGFELQTLDASGVFLSQRGKRKDLLFCEHWKEMNVDVSILRQALELSVRYQTNRVTVFCRGTFSPEAMRFTRGRPIDLVGGAQFLEMARQMEADIRMKSRLSKNRQKS